MALASDLDLPSSNRLQKSSPTVTRQISSDSRISHGPPPLSPLLDTLLFPGLRSLGNQQTQSGFYKKTFLTSTAPLLPPGIPPFSPILIPSREVPLLQPLHRGVIAARSSWSFLLAFIAHSATQPSPLKRLGFIFIFVARLSGQHALSGFSFSLVTEFSFFTLFPRGGLQLENLFLLKPAFFIYSPTFLNQRIFLLTKQHLSTSPGESF